MRQFETFVAGTKVYWCMMCGAFRLATPMNTRAWLFGLAMALTPVVSAWANGSEEQALLSIEGLTLADDEYVDGFKIQTWGVEMLAVCHFPPSWRITAGNYVDPVGTISGETGAGIAWLDRSSLHELRGLVLVRISGYQPLPRGSVPASFTGWVRVGSRSADRGRRVKLRPANFVFAKAKSCTER